MFGRNKKVVEPKVEPKVESKVEPKVVNVHIDTVVINIASVARSTDSAVITVTLDAAGLAKAGAEIAARVVDNPQELEHLGLHINMEGDQR